MYNAKTSVTQEDIDRLIAGADISIQTVYDKCTLVTVKLKNGFVLSASSACVDPKNYSQELGASICMEHIKDELWKLEGYALQKKLSEPIAYVCDRKRCGDKCDTHCEHTLDIEHAANFKSYDTSANEAGYVTYVEGGFT